MAKVRKFYKSAVSGRFVSKRQVKASPKTTITQKTRRGRR